MPPANELLLGPPSPPPPDPPLAPAPIAPRPPPPPFAKYISTPLLFLIDESKPLVATAPLAFAKPPLPTLIVLFPELKVCDVK